MLPLQRLTPMSQLFPSNPQPGARASAVKNKHKFKIRREEKQASAEIMLDSLRP
jgi:hypothetical protein